MWRSYLKMNQVLCHVKGIRYEDFSEQEEMVEDNRKFTISHHLASLSEFHMSGGRFAKLISECKQASPVNELLQLHITWNTSKMENAANAKNHQIVRSKFSQRLEDEFIGYNKLQRIAHYWTILQQAKKLWWREPKNNKNRESHT